MREFANIARGSDIVSKTMFCRSSAPESPIGRFRTFLKAGASPLVVAVAVALTTGTSSSAVASGNAFKVLYSFAGNGDAAYPYAGLITDKAGNLYGTTIQGGANGDGTIFEITPSGTESILHSFTGGADGSQPHGPVIMDKDGNLYGATTYAGAGGAGVVFKIAPDGTYTVLHSFNKNDANGGYPMGGVIRDKRGDLYGTTQNFGANNQGVVFKIKPNGVYTVLHAFGSFSGDGGTPGGGNLLRDAAGNLYGATNTGGTYNLGTVFKLAPDGTETILHSFTWFGADGNLPNGDLIMDKSGNLYGTAAGGDGDSYYAEGEVFKITSDGDFKVLHDFTGGNGTGDGQGPDGGLFLDIDGNLFGTTCSGGKTGSDGAGTIFEISAGGVENVVYSFTGGSDGYCPTGSLIKDGLTQRGYFFGTASNGGGSGGGTVFEIKK